MAGKTKYYTLSKDDLEELVSKAAAAGQEAGLRAYAQENRSRDQNKVNRMLYKTRILLEKYRYLKEYCEKSVYTLEQAEEADENDLDIELLMRFGILDEDYTVKRMQKGVMTCKILMAHVDKMIAVYREDSENSPSPVKRRQWTVLWNMYLAEDRKSTREIADMIGEELRTIQNDAKAVREDLTALIFGIDGLLIRILRD